MLTLIDSIRTFKTNLTSEQGTLSKEIYKLLMYKKDFACKDFNLTLSGQ